MPAELRTNYEYSERKGSAEVETLKVAAALKLWVNRGYREFGFEVSSDLGGRTFYVDVLAKDEDGMVGVECASGINLGRLRRRVAQLRRSLPESSYLVIVFPFGVDDKLVDKAVGLADEVWAVGKNGTVERMMFMSVFHKGPTASNTES